MTTTGTPQLAELLVNNVDTIREVLDDWLSWSTIINDYDQTQTPILDPDLEERAFVLRKALAETTGELDDHPAA